jgi:hypothetical protein
MPNLYSAFAELLPQDQVSVCTVQAEMPDGTTAVLTVDNQPLRVLGVNGRAAGAKVFVQSGKIIADAPDLPASLVTV